MKSSTKVHFQTIWMCVCVCVFSRQGFEPRGTDIGVRQSSLSQLQENTGPGKLLSPFPAQLSKRSAESLSLFLAMFDPQQTEFVLMVCDSFGGGVSRNSSHSAFRHRVKRMLARDSSPQTFLCDAPGGSVCSGHGRFDIYYYY